ncbi:hypothetical protein ACN38_g12041, partial [Penicillium nordicum]
MTNYSLALLLYSIVYSIKIHPPPQLAAKRSADFLQVQFTFISDSFQIHFRFISDSFQIHFRFI